MLSSQLLQLLFRFVGIVREKSLVQAFRRAQSRAAAEENVDEGELFDVPAEYDGTQREWG